MTHEIDKGLMDENASDSVVELVFHVFVGGMVADQTLFALHAVRCRESRVRDTCAPNTMTRIPKEVTWLVLLLLVSQWTCFWCMEEEALLLDDKEFCVVPGAADVSTCEWIVEQLKDQSPDLTYDFFCSKEKDCDSQFVEGEVVDWFFGGCNGPKIVNRLCGCCVFKPEPSTSLFSLDANGITVRCPDAAIGATGEVQGTTYTKRTRDQITDENAATTCTSGITDMSELFAGTFESLSTFNGGISRRGRSPGDRGGPVPGPSPWVL